MAKEKQRWYTLTLSGIVITGLVILVRLYGSLQLLEWLAIDAFLRLRPEESRDERIVIVGIDEEDIEEVGDYPIPDENLASLINKLQIHKPRAIGLDIVRNLPVEPGHKELAKVLSNYKNIIAVEKVQPPLIKAPPYLPSEQVGFVDVFYDSDGKVRRSFLGTFRDETKQEYTFSFSLLLAQAYLEAEGKSLENGIRDIHAMSFASTELPRFLANTGGYVKEDDSGVQIMLNPRNTSKPFRVLSLRDIEEGNFDSQWINESLVIIGVMAPSIRDTVNTSAISNLPLPEKIYGAEFHGHATSQILSAVLDGRPILRSWPNAWEYVWLAAWGLLTIILNLASRSLWKHIFIIVSLSILLGAFSYALLYYGGLWIAVVPVWLILLGNGFLFPALYEYNRLLRTAISIRQDAIEHTFDQIHNGPLQSLANFSRQLQEQDLPQEQLLSRLKKLDNEIREVGDYLKKEALADTKSIRLGNGVKLDLRVPLHELLYKVYSYTLEREFPNFSHLKVKARKFEPIEAERLSIKQKRKLCQFLEEALCNVGKHAQGATHIKVTGVKNEGWYTLRVEDNGAGLYSSRVGQGTRHFKNLARLLGGKFKRESLAPKGTVCWLSWPLVNKISNLRRIYNYARNLGKCGD